MAPSKKILTFIDTDCPVFRAQPKKAVKYRQVSRLMDSLGKKCFPEEDNPAVSLARHIIDNLPRDMDSLYGEAYYAYGKTSILLIEDLRYFVEQDNTRSYFRLRDILRIVDKNVADNAGEQDILELFRDCLVREAIFAAAYEMILCNEFNARSLERRLWYLPDDYDYDEATKEDISKVIDVVEYIARESGLENCDEIFSVLRDEADAKNRRLFVNSESYKRDLRIAAIPVSSWLVFCSIIRIINWASPQVKCLTWEKEYEELGAIDTCTAFLAGVPIEDIE